MLNETRVLSFQRAREMSEEEAQLVNGARAIHTQTLCTFNFQGAIDGDRGEC